MFSHENGPDYVEAYTQTVLQLHHGIELAIKELLRQKHPLLASSRLPDSAVLLCRMLNGETMSFEDAENLRSTEFGQALQRVIALANEGLLDGDLSIIVENERLLSGLNTLRNRIIHRGMFRQFAAKPCWARVSGFSVKHYLVKSKAW